MGLGALANLIGKGVGLAVKTAPKINKAFGMINKGSRAFGQLSQAGRTFGTVANQVSGGKLASSSFGKTAEKLLDKADQANVKISNASMQGEAKVNEALERLKRY